MQYPISFALNLAIPTDKAIGAKHVFCTSATSPTEAADSAGMKDSGSKVDEADEDTLKVSCAMMPRCQFFCDFFVFCIFSEPCAANFRHAF